MDSKTTFKRGKTTQPSAWGTDPLLDPIGPAEGGEEDAFPEAAPKGNACLTSGITMGILAFIVVMALAGLGIWRFYVAQDDITKLNNRLLVAEALLIDHTYRLNSLNTTLIATVAQVNTNTIDISSLNATQISQGQQISSLDNRTTLLEQRLTQDELKLLGVMNNVTVLQAQMATALANIATLQTDVLSLQVTVANHEIRIQNLEMANIQNMANIQLLFQYLQGNLTIIDQRLNILNTTYTVTASGMAMVRSADAIPLNVTWETRVFVATGGLTVEYLWISRTCCTLLIRNAPTDPFSFEIANFTTTSPAPALAPAPSISLDRPLFPFQQSKFAFVTNLTNPQVLSSKWNNDDATLEFKSNLLPFDAVSIVTPLTFVIGFL